SSVPLPPKLTALAALVPSSTSRSLLPVIVSVSALPLSVIPLAIVSVPPLAVMCAAPLALIAPVTVPAPVIVPPDSEIPEASLRAAPADMLTVPLSARVPVTVSVPLVTFSVPELVTPAPLSDTALVPLLLIVPELLMAAAPAPCVSCNVPPESVIVPALLIAAVPVSVRVPLIVIVASELLGTAEPLVGDAPLSSVSAPPIQSVNAPVTVSVPPVTWIVPELLISLWLSDSALVALLLIVPELLIAAAPLPWVSCSVPPDNVIVPALLIAAVPVSVRVPLTVIVASELL